MAGGALILPTFVRVTALAACARLGDLPWVTAVVHGVNPTVIALIPQSWWRLGRRCRHDLATGALEALWKPYVPLL